MWSGLACPWMCLLLSLWSEENATAFNKLNSRRAEVGFTDLLAGLCVCGFSRRNFSEACRSRILSSFNPATKELFVEEGERKGENCVNGFGKERAGGSREGVGDRCVKRWERGW